MNILNIFSSELKKLSEESLTRQPEEVFDIICKLGEGWVLVFAFKEFDLKKIF